MGDAMFCSRCMGQMARGTRSEVVDNEVFVVEDWECPNGCERQAEEDARQQVSL